MNGIYLRKCEYSQLYSYAICSVAIADHTNTSSSQNNLRFIFSDAPPVMLYSFIEQTLQPGPAVSLKCSAAGNPTPQVV